MKPLRYLLSASLVAPLLLALAGCAAPPAHASSEDEAFTHALTLVQSLVGAAARSDDPQASLKAIDDVLAGRNAEANRALAGLMDDATADMSPENRGRVASIGRDMAARARRQAAAAPDARPAGAESALQARKDLNAMGLRYYDEDQFRAAVKRGDKLAVDLFIAANGIDPAVISRTLPAAR